MNTSETEQILARLIVAIHAGESRADNLKAVQDAVVDAGWLERWELDEDQDWAFVQFIESEIISNLVVLPDNIDGVKSVS